MGAALLAELDVLYEEAEFGRARLRTLPRRAGVIDRLKIFGNVNAITQARPC